jgi:tRNA threonylcarbamoyladenosine modification (KEOPS) complex Cgi121 subunit
MRKQYLKNLPARHVDASTLRFRLKSMPVVAVKLCLSGGGELCVKDVLPRVEALLPRNMYVSLFDDCRKLPPRGLLLSALAYTCRGLLEGRTISRKPGLDLLLYLQGDRNIHMAVQRFSSGCGRRLGAVFFALGVELEDLRQAVEGVLGGIGLQVEEQGENESIDFYAEIAGVPGEKAIDHLRARMALEALEV